MTADNKTTPQADNHDDIRAEIERLRVRLAQIVDAMDPNKKWQLYKAANDRFYVVVNKDGKSAALVDIGAGYVPHRVYNQAGKLKYLVAGSSFTFDIAVIDSAPYGVANIEYTITTVDYYNEALKVPLPDIVVADGNLRVEGQTIALNSAATITAAELAAKLANMPDMCPEQVKAKEEVALDIHEQFIQDVVKFTTATDQVETLNSANQAELSDSANQAELSDSANQAESSSSATPGETTA